MDPSPRWSRSRMYEERPHPRFPFWFCCPIPISSVPKLKLLAFQYCGLCSSPPRNWAHLREVSSTVNSPNFCVVQGLVKHENANKYRSESCSVVPARSPTPPSTYIFNCIFSALQVGGFISKATLPNRTWKPSWFDFQFPIFDFRVAESSVRSWWMTCYFTTLLWRLEVTDKRGVRSYAIEEDGQISKTWAGICSIGYPCPVFHLQAGGHFSR